MPGLKLNFTKLNRDRYCSLSDEGSLCGRRVEVRKILKMSHRRDLVGNIYLNENASSCFNTKLLMVYRSFKFEVNLNPINDIFLQ